MSKRRIRAALDRAVRGRFGFSLAFELLRECVARQSRSQIAGTSNTVMEFLEVRTLFGAGYAPGVPYTGPVPCPTCPPVTGPLAGSPPDAGTEGDPPIVSTAPVDYFTGEPTITTTDLEIDSFGMEWGVTRAWTGMDNSGLTGNGWQNTSLPYLIISQDQVYGSHNGLIMVMEGSSTQLEFSVAEGADFSSSVSSSNFTPLFQSQYEMSYIGPTTPGSSPPTPGYFELTDPVGDVTTFYGLPTTTEASGQAIWALNDYQQEPTSVGNSHGTNYYTFGAFAGYTDDEGNQVTAVYDQNGSDATKGELTEVDLTATGGQEQRFYYTYANVTNTLGGSAVLTSQISLQERPSSESSWTTASFVNYNYYTGTDSDAEYGRLGDLRTATIEDVVNGTDEVESEDYYRYDKFWSGTFLTSYYNGGYLDGDTSLGGVEGYDWSQTYYDSDTDEYITTTPVYDPVYPNGPTNDPSTTGGTDTTFPQQVGGADVPYTDFDDYGPDTVVSSGIEAVVQGPAFAGLMADAGSLSNIESMSTADIEPYANYTFSYQRIHDGDLQNPLNYQDSYQVTSETVGGAGCDCAGVNGAGTYTYTYSLNPALDGTPPDLFGAGFGTSILSLPDSNEWVEKTTVTLPNDTPDSTNNDREIVYTNAVGAVLMTVQVASNGTENSATDQALVTYYEYDDEGRLILEAEPSAMAPYNPANPIQYEQYANLVGPDDQNIYASKGLINTWTYWTSTTTAGTCASGNVNGYLVSQAVQEGIDGTSIETSSQDYIAHADSGTGATVYLVAHSTTYPTTTCMDERTTTNCYTFSGTSNQVATMTTTEPAVASDENGSGTGNTTEVMYDSYGRPVWTVDGNGYITYTKYDPVVSAT